MGWATDPGYGTSRATGLASAGSFSSGPTCKRLALANHQLERPEETLAALEHLTPIGEQRYDVAFSSMALRAMAHHRLGDRAAARRWLGEARSLFDRVGGAEKGAWARSSWYAHVVEAGELID